MSRVAFFFFPRYVVKASNVNCLVCPASFLEEKTNILFLPFVRKEPSPRWCKVRKRCSCVRTGWRTCPTPMSPPLRWRMDFRRFQCSLPGMTALALPVSRSRTPPGRHLSTAGSLAGGKTSPPPRLSHSSEVRRTVRKKWAREKKKK